MSFLQIIEEKIPRLTIFLQTREIQHYFHCTRQEENRSVLIIEPEDELIIASMDDIIKKNGIEELYKTLHKT